MKKGIEYLNRTNNPERTVGLDEEKINNTIGTVTHRAGQKGKTVIEFSVLVWRVL
ncbi:MAG: hypothetical protein M3Q81_01860 [bacterium]|nr:hypothetical protein [bacterium]